MEYHVARVEHPYDRERRERGLENYPQFSDIDYPAVWPWNPYALPIEHPYDRERRERGLPPKREPPIMGELYPRGPIGDIGPDAEGDLLQNIQLLRHELRRLNNAISQRKVEHRQPQHTRKELWGEPDNIRIDGGRGNSPAESSQR